MSRYFELIQWSLVWPGYFAIRVLSGAHGALESDYHKRKRIPCLATAIHRTRLEVEKYLREADTSPRLLEFASSLNEVPWQGQFRAAKELYAIVRILRPEIVVETGVGAGFSSEHILLAMEENGSGHLYSVDLPDSDPGWKLMSGRDPGFLVPLDLRQRWTMLLGDSRELLPSLLDKLGSIDIFLHDSAHTMDVMSFEYSAAYGRLKPGGLLVSDDALWNTALLQTAKSHKLRVYPIYHGGGSSPVAVIRHEN